MCRNYLGRCFVSIIATWGFFALLIRLLNVADPFVNAIWLTLLVSVAMFFCPVMNPNFTDFCKAETKKKK